MKVLVVGSGAREHALAWTLKQSSSVSALYCLAGNAGTAQIATNLKGSASELDTVIAAAKQHAIGSRGLVLPELPKSKIRRGDYVVHRDHGIARGVSRDEHRQFMAEKLAGRVSSTAERARSANDPGSIPGPGVLWLMKKLQ